jgi:hypothetical protein
MPPSTATSEQGEPQGSPKNYAPHLDDPDPPLRIMTPEESRAAARRAKMLMIAKGYEFPPSKG